MPRSYVAACAVGAAFGVVVVLLVVTVGGIYPSNRHYTDDFFDAQARSWFSGRWDVPSDVVGGEGFETDRGTQIYFGITPSVMRVPILAVTKRFDGKLGELSEMAALVLLLVSLTRVMWTVRSRLVEPADDIDDVPIFTLLVSGLFIALVGGASSATFLASLPTVFAEAILWAIALTVASADQLLRFLLIPSTTRIVAAGAFAGAALNARVTTGLGALAAIMVILVATMLPAHPSVLRMTRRLVPDPQGLRRYFIPMVVMLGLSFAVCFGANVARFGHPWKIPNEKQIVYRYDTDRLALLQTANGLFSSAYLETDLVAYFRPDGISMDRWPVVTFRDPRDTFVRNASPNVNEPTASVPAAMPGLSVLAMVGGVLMVGRRSRGRLVALRLPVLGAAGSAVFIVTFASLAHRYTGDFMPLLSLLGAAGAARAGTITGGGQRLATGFGLALLTVWGAWVTISLATWTSAHNSLRSRPALEALVPRLVDLESGFGGFPVIPSPASPPAEPKGWELMARPDCARVYVAHFNGWYAFERAPGTGAFHLRVTPPPPDGAPHSLTRSADGRLLVGLRNRDGAATVELSTDGGATWRTSGTMRSMRPDRSTVPAALPLDGAGFVDLVIDYDWFTGMISASGPSPDTFLAVRQPLTGAAQSVEVDTGYPGYPGSVVVAAEPAPQCRLWTTGSG